MVNWGDAVEEVSEVSGQVELIGKRWGLLECLSIRDYRVNELASKFRSSPPLISKNLKELKERGLVEKTNGDGGAKCFRSTDLAKRLLRAVKQATEPESKPKLEDWRVSELLSVLEDEELSCDLRLSYSETLKKACLEYPREVVGNENARRVFERVAKEPFRNEVYQKMAECLSSPLTYAKDPTQHITEENWLSRRFLPILLNNIKNRHEKVSVWSVKEVGKIAGLSDDFKVKVRNELLEVWFSKEVKADDAVGTEVCKQLSRLGSQDLFKTVRAKVQSKDTLDKTKAEILLEQLGQSLL